MQNDPGMMPPEDSGPPPTAEEIATELFARCILNQVQTAMVLLGRGEHPAIGEPLKDVARARKLIDQLELLESKPEGLGAEETRLVRESLHELRLAYVEAVGKQPAAPETTALTTDPAATEPEDEDKDEDGGRKRFVKKYD